jgi:hypothetical protein
MDLRKNSEVILFAFKYMSLVQRSEEVKTLI